MPVFGDLAAFARLARAALCFLPSAPRRNFSSRFLWRSSLSAAFASSADVTLTETAVPSILVKRMGASCILIFRCDTRDHNLEWRRL